MDNLSMNIFVPETKFHGNNKLKQKSIKSGSKLTVVRSSSKKIADVAKITEKHRKSPQKLKALKNPSSKFTKDSKPFLLSEKFGKNVDKSANLVEGSEDGFSVSFVKPKIFQKKKIEPKKVELAKKKIDMMVNTENVDESQVKSFQKKKIEPKKVESSKKKIDIAMVDSENVEGQVKSFQKKIGSKDGTSKWDDLIEKVDGTQDIVDGGVVDDDVRYSNGGSSLFQEGAWKRNVKANKWFGGSNAHVDFGDVRVGSKSEIGREKSLKRKADFKDGTKPKKDKKEVCSDVKSKGPVSSLFSYEPPPEPLDDDNVVPWEERLFSKKTFKDAGIHPHLVGNLEQLFGITNMTVVQKKTLPELMAGKDGLVRSQTGSGKTLAYAIPIMHSLQQATPKIQRKDGVKALIVLPTRELALQTYECFVKLMRAFTWIVPGVVIGGEKRKSEKVRLRKGITVLIGTPGRLLDHAEHSENLSLHGIDWLVIDEADKLLEMGYERDISQLMSIIDSQRERAENKGRKQTVLLSATLTSAVEKLANLALKSPAYIDACNDTQQNTDIMVIPQTLEQKYVVVPAKMRLVALSSFLIEVTELKKSNKVLIFMATQDMVDFYLDLIPAVLSSTVKFFKLHGNMSQGDRTEVFNAFRKSEKGVLLSTDVAARGLDLPLVNWIVQFTAPTTPAEYVHRVGRTARVGTTGSALLFLLPSELHFVSMLNSSRIKLDEVSVDSYLKCLLKIHLESKDGQRWGGGVEGAATVLQHNFENALLEDKTLHEIACKAYKSWVRFYATYPKDLRVVFDFKSLHLGHNAKSFALRDPPKAIGGIGKPKKGEKWGKGTDMRPIKRRKPDRLGHITEGSRTKKLILSEFDSGLKRMK